MDTVHYIGFDVHKKTIAICVKAADGKILIADNRIGPPPPQGSPRCYDRAFT